MKNFTAALLSFYKSVVSNSGKYQTGKKSGAKSIVNYRANLFECVSTRNFLWEFYGILSNLFKSLRGHLVPVLKGLNNLEKFRYYLNLVTVSRVYLNLNEASTASRSLVLLRNRTTVNNLMRGLSLLLMVFLVSFCSLAQNPTAPALGFNIFVKNGATLITNESEGAVAIGGDLTLAGDYRVANVSAGTFTVGGVKIGLVVGGKVIYSSGNGLTINSGGYVKIGNCNGNTVWYTDPNDATSNIQITTSSVYNTTPRINLNSSATTLGVSAINNPVCSSTSLDFDVAFNQLQSNSTGLASLTQNLFFTDQNGNTLSGPLAGNLTLKLIAGTTNVVNISLTDFNNITNINYSNGAPSSTTPLIFNITTTGTGTATFTVPSMGGLSSSSAVYTLFNFPNATDLVIKGGVLEGSVLAPFASLNKIIGANIEGQVIALSLIHNGDEVHNFPFNVVIPNIPTASCTGITGSVFRDFNLNGKKDNAKEIGLAGVTVKAFKPDNTQASSTATTFADGTYSITGASGQLRIEFSNLPTGYVSGPDGTTSSTSIQFVTATTTAGCNVNFGVNHPDDFCTKEGVQPKVAVPCYANGKYDATGTLGAGLEDALVSFPYNRTGDKATSGNNPFVVSKFSTIGSVWGMAYNKYNKTLFATAFMKRHTGFGPQGIAGLYVVQNADNNGSGYTITGINLQTVLGINAGTEPTRNLSADKTQPTDDGGNTVFNAVGKMSFGDAELSTDGNTLYITNLFDKKIYVLNVTNPLSPTLITSYSVPDPGCNVVGEYAPFGLKFYRGKLYVGVVCTAQSTQPTPNLTISNPPLNTQYGQSGFNRLSLSSANLEASVYELNGSAFTAVLPQFPLNYDRGNSNSGNTSYSIWRPWVSTWSQVPSNISETYPQPMLSDIEFDTDGSMILGFADRFSHQLGNANYAPGTTSTVTGRVEGDVMRATKGAGSTWTIENNGTASGTATFGTNKGGGPGGGEYYFGDLTIDHDEPAMGGLALYPGTGEIMTTVAGPVNIFYSGGTRRMNNKTGDFLYAGSPIAWNNVANYRLNYASRPTPTGDYKLYEGQNPATFGKASGLGDIEVFCSLAPLEIGNRIWRDYDQDGIQDANEPGIPSITVLLFKGGLQVASTATDVNGEYYFNDANVTGGLLPNTAYEIRVATGQTNLANTFLSPTNANSNNSNEIDSDATISGSNAIINLTTGGYGESNHTYDIGFSPNCPTLSNHQPNNGTVTVCAGTTPQLTLSASNVGTQPLPVTTTIEWIYFTSAQADPYTSSATKVVLTPVKPLADGTITSSFTNFPTTAGTYYVYACLKPVPDASNPNCRPFVSYIVTVNSIPSTPTVVTGGSVCKSGSTATVSLSASCGSGETAVWYTSNATTAVSIGTGSPFTTPAISATTTYYVGCKNTTTNCETVAANRVSAEAIVINTPAAPTVTVIGGGVNNVCGSSATLESGCATGSLKWSTGATTNQIQVLTTGTYTATCILSTCASNVSNAVTITLNNKPSTPTISGGEASICLGSSATLTASACAGTYTWSNGVTGTTATSITVTPTVAATTNYTVTCTTNGCTSLASASASVTVNPIPVPPTTQNVVGGAVCVNPGTSGTVNLTAVCGTNEIPQWYNGNVAGSTFIVAGTAYSPSINVTTTYYVGCKNTLTGCENPFGNRTPVIGTVNTNPAAPTSGNVTPASRCDAGTVILTATCLTGTAQWYNGNAVSSTFLFAGTSYSVSINATTTYYVGCKSTTGPTFCETPAGSRTAVVGTVNPNLPAPASNQVTGGQTCGIGTVQLTASCSTGQKPQWYNNNTTIGVALFEGNTYITASISVTTTYYVGCKDDLTGCETLPANRRGVVATYIKEVDNGGQVAKSQVYCGPSQPAPFTSIAPATGSSTTVEYLWLTNKNTTDTVFTPDNESLWVQVAGATSATFAPPFANATIAYIRCARSAGCEFYTAESNVVVIRIYPIPTPPTNPTISKSAVCLGESISLSATCGTNQQANWYEGTTLLGSGNLTFVPTVGGHTYSVSCQDKTTGCETADANRTKVTVTVNPIPATPANPTINKSAICIGESVSLSATCATNETAQWYEGTTAIGIGNFTYTPTILGSHTYTVGCRNNSTNCETATANRGKITLQINEIPAAPTVATGGAVCGSGSINLTATCATGTISVWYNTQNATTSLSVGNTFNVAVTANRTYYVSCRSTISPTFCESPASSRKAVEVIYNNNPVPTVSATPNAICVGGTTKLKVNEIFATYAWKGPNGFSNSNQSVDITNIVTGNAGVYTVTVSAAGSCTASATVNVTVNTNPSVTASVTDNTVCQQSTIELRSAATAGTGTISSYAWTGPNTYTVGIQNPNIVTATSAMTGAYIVKVTDINGCTATSQVSVIINPLPTAAASSEGGNTVCLGAPISFVASGAGIGGSYQWIGPAGSGFSETTQSPTIVSTILANAGVYTLKITNSNGCIAITTINIIIDKCLRIGNLVWEDTNNNGIVDGTEAGVTTPVKVELYKANPDGTLGAFVATQNTVSGKYLFSGLEPGDYIVQITAPTGYKSSTGTNGLATGAYELAPDPDNDKDNDDNGSFESGQIIRSKPVTLQNFNEPTNDGDDNNGNLTVDFGIYQPSKLGDFVFNDDNRNGQQDATETGVTGVTVNLYDSSSATIPVATATTDANGKYLFDNLKPDTYVVEFVKSTLLNDKQFTTQNVNPDATDSDANIGTGKSDPIVLGIADTNLTIDAGIQCPLPTPTATTTTTQVCVGGIIKLTATGGKAYSWKGPNAFSETTADVTINNAIIANTGTYIVTVTADNKCNATATAIVAVIINSNPTVSATGAVVCTEESINLKAQGSGTFSWKGPNSFSRAEQNPVITGATALNAGVYTVTVTNGSSCNVSTTVNVVVNERPAAPTETNKNKSNICEGETLSLSGVCATGSTIKWYKADGITELNPSQNFNPGPVGTYVYYAVCKNNVTGCETTNNLHAKVTVTVDGIPTAVTPTVSKGIICKGETVSLSATCGTNEEPVWYIGTPTTPYTGSLTFIPAVGTYTYYVSCKSKTGAYCETAAPNRKPVTLIVNDNPTASATVADNTVCTGSTIELKGAGSGSTFVWRGPGFNRTEQNPSIANAVITNSGVYTLTVINSVSNCSATSTVSVSVLVNPIVTASGATVCMNDLINLKSTPNLTGTTTGNVVKTYAWTGPNNFTDSVQNPTITKATTLNGGVYTVTITDNNGCTAIAYATVKVNILPTPTASSNTPICTGNELTLSVTEYVGGSYSWAVKATFTGSTVREPSISQATTANSGTYTVKVTDINGCTAIATTSVVINPLPTAIATSNSPVCLNNKLTLEVATNGTYYAWTGPAGSGFTSTSQKPEIVSAVAANEGVYTVVVSNGNNCSATATVNVVVNPLPTTVATGAEVCVGKPVTLDATAGFTSYAWTKVGGIFTASTQSPSVTASAVTGDVGVYQVLVTNANGCTAIATATVIVNELPVPTAQNNGPVCVGTTITLTANAGFAKYAWVDSKNVFVGSTAVVTIPNAVIGNEGIYTVTVTNAKRCIATATTEVKVNTNPNPTITPIPAVCLGGNIVLNVSGTTGNTYAWSGSGFTSTEQNPTVDPKPTTAGTYTYFVTVQGAGGCTGTAKTSVTIKALPTVTVPSTTICTGTTGTLTASAADSYAWSGPNGFTGTTQAVTVKGKGTYTVTITSGGCTAVATTTVDEKPTADIKAASVEICTDGAKVLTATGGATYTWTGAGFTATGATVTVPTAGTYTVTGITEGGCVGTATAKLTIKENPTVTITGNTIVCSGGKTILTASGTGTFVWTGLDSFTATTATVNVSAGTYQVTVTNAGCSAVGTIKVVNDNLSITAGGATVCEGGSAGLTGGATATSGIQSYAWSGPNGFTSSELSPSVTKPTATGTYTLTVTSKAGCTATATAIITVTPAVTKTANVTFCKGGKAILIATGGTGATYLWTGGATTSSIEVTTAGTYNVTITDASGCISKGIFTVTESAAASAIITGNTSLCTSTSTKLTVNEGTTGETYTWTGVGGFTSTSQVVTVSTPGDYAVLVKAQQGCEGTAKVTVTAGFTPTAVCGPVCEGDSIRFSAIQLKGLTYSWSKNGTFISSSADPKLLNVQKSDAGIYEVVITGGGCTATVVATLIVYEKPTGITATAQNSTCDQDTPKNDGAVKLAGTFTGLKYDIVEGATYTGTKKYADATDIPANGIVKSGIANPATNAGTKYTVRVFNANNCYADYTVTIQQVVCSCGEAKCVPYGVIKTKSGKR